MSKSDDSDDDDDSDGDSGDEEGGGDGGRGGRVSRGGPWMRHTTIDRGLDIVGPSVPSVPSSLANVGESSQVATLQSIVQSL
jgi:hypothetical protein